MTQDLPEEPQSGKTSLASTLKPSKRASSVAVVMLAVAAIIAAVAGLAKTLNLGSLVEVFVDNHRLPNDDKAIKDIIAPIVKAAIAPLVKSDSAKTVAIQDLEGRYAVKKVELGAANGRALVEHGAAITARQAEMRTKGELSARTKELSLEKEHNASLAHDTAAAHRATVIARREAANEKRQRELAEHRAALAKSWGDSLSRVNDRSNQGMIAFKKAARLQNQALEHGKLGFRWASKYRGPLIDQALAYYRVAYSYSVVTTEEMKRIEYDLNLAR